MRCCVTLASLLLSASAVLAQDEPATRSFTIEDQPRMAVELIGATDTPPDAGFGLLVVLPGGDGGEGFAPFVRRIQQHATPSGYLTVRLTAVKWSDDQPVVWPIAGHKIEAAAFTTEQYIAAAVERVAQDVPVDRSRVVVLGWSSSGPAAYAAMLTDQSAVSGAIVAMSVFKPDVLPPLERAAGRAFYLLHSPQDRVVPVQYARTAASWLRRADADVTLQEYDGGHGWQGDVFGMIRGGIDWLDGHADRMALREAERATEPAAAVNLLSNGGFEAGLDGWIIGDNSGRMRLDLDTTTKVEGVQALRITKNGGVPLDIVRLDLDDPPAGQPLTLSMQVRAQGVGNAWVKCFAWDEAGNDLIRDVDVTRIAGSHDWRRIGRRYTLPPGTARVAVQVWMILDGTLWLDDVRVEPANQ